MLYNIGLYNMKYSFTAKFLVPRVVYFYIIMEGNYYVII